MKDPIVIEKFKHVLKTVTSLGVKGVRLINAKHLIIGQTVNESPDQFQMNYPHTNYKFWTHTQTTYQEGLGDLLGDFKKTVHNTTNDDGFLSVTESISKPEIFQRKLGSMGVDIPVFGTLPESLAQSSTSKTIESELKGISDQMGGSWLQWLEPNRLYSITESEYNIFVMLLPGVPVSSSKAFDRSDADKKLVAQLETIRKSPSYMHGSFDVYTNNSVIAYTRFVVFVFFFRLTGHY